MSLQSFLLPLLCADLHPIILGYTNALQGQLRFSLKSEDLPKSSNSKDRSITVQDREGRLRYFCLRDTQLLEYVSKETWLPVKSELKLAPGRQVEMTANSTELFFVTSTQVQAVNFTTWALRSWSLGPTQDVVLGPGEAQGPAAEVEGGEFETLVAIKATETTLYVDNFIYLHALDLAVPQEASPTCGAVWTHGSKFTSEHDLEYHTMHSTDCMGESEGKIYTGVLLSDKDAEPISASILRRGPTTPRLKHRLAIQEFDAKTLKKLRDLGPIHNVSPVMVAVISEGFLYTMEDNQLLRAFDLNGVTSGSSSQLEEDSRIQIQTKSRTGFTMTVGKVQVIDGRVHVHINNDQNRGDLLQVYS